MPPVMMQDVHKQPQQQQQQQQVVPLSILREGRYKLSRACDRCRKRRIRCDEGYPCQPCSHAESDCTFDEPVKRVHHPHKPKPKRALTLEERMRRIELLVDAIPSTVFATSGVVPPTVSSPAAALVDFSSGVPPPSLDVLPLAGPSAHFTRDLKSEEMQHNPQTIFSSCPGISYSSRSQIRNPDQLAEATSRMSLTPSYLYFDDEGCTRWQGETSGFPVLDLLIDRRTPAQNQSAANSQSYPDSSHPPGDKPVDGTNSDQLSNKILHLDANPHTIWKLTVSSIDPELMDSLVRCYLSTSYYILPFLHVPTFLTDYGNPRKWGEPGFAAFIVAVCCLASRHIDDPRVRARPDDGISAGVHWYELFNQLQIYPIADRPTLYNIQANLIGAVYAVGLGRISRAAALLAESVTMCIDAGLHRSADTYDLFDPIEDEVRKRTFWCVYIWDKQLGAHFGRPSILRLRDCDVAEPTPVDDEYITREAIGTPPPGVECRMSAFLVSLRIMVVLESILDVPPARQSDESNSFLLRATNVLHGVWKFRSMREEEALLDEIHRKVPAFWAHSPETLASEDKIRITQAERLHCAEQFVRLLIYRHRFSEYLAERTCGPREEEQTSAEKEALIAAHEAALQIVFAHVNIAQKGLMTYYGVHVIHQLTQAGRTLVAVLLCCEVGTLQHLIPPGLSALHSCIGLLRKFSGRYICGLRSGDLMEEFCRLTHIPLDFTNGTRPDASTAPSSRRAWIQRIRKKAPSAPRSTYSGDSNSHHSSPEAFSPEFFSGETSKPATFSAAPSAASGSSVLPMLSSAQLDGTKHPPPSLSSNFLDTPTSMGMNVIQEGLYMSQGDMMALLTDAEVNPLFPPDFGMSDISGQHQRQMPEPQQPPSAVDQQDVLNSPGTAGYIGPGYMKMNSLETS